MTRKGLGTVGLDKLEATLDTYGADRTRWPAPLRHALSGLIAGAFQLGSCRPTTWSTTSLYRESR